MRVGYQGEPGSYSYQAAGELLLGAERVGFASFAAAFHALVDKEVDRLVLPIENSTTGSVLPVLDRLVESPASIIAEYVVEVRHALLGLAGSKLETIKTVRSHPEALGRRHRHVGRALAALLGALQAADHPLDVLGLLSGGFGSLGSEAGELGGNVDFSDFGSSDVAVTGVRRCRTLTGRRRTPFFTK